jgi:hypothetical protein
MRNKALTEERENTVGTKTMKRSFRNINGELSGTKMWKLSGNKMIKKKF